MRVLVACEFSGVVAAAFRARGAEAWSCDLLPTEGDPRWHIQGDVLTVIGDRWDLMVAHPPCTELAVSGARWWASKREEDRRAGRPDRQVKAIEFVRALWNAPIPRICIENPVSILSSKLAPPTQIVQPWQFGHPESKATCLWLRGLPRLQPTDVLPLPASGRWKNQTASGQNKLPPSEDRWKLRSKTYAGLAAAMAAQWGNSERV